MITTTKIYPPRFLPLKSFLAYATGDERLLTRMGNGWVEVSPPPYDRDDQSRKAA